VELFTHFETATNYVALITRCGAPLRMREGPVVEEDVARTVIRQLLQSLVFLSDIGIVHGDVHCGNLLWHKDPDCGAVLIDFGLAQVAHEDPVPLCGTHPAPEQGSEAPTFASDVFAVGCSLQSLLFGVDQGMEDTFSSPQHLEQLFASRRCSDAALRSLLEALLAASPSDRPTAREALRHPWCLGARTHSAGSCRRSLQGG